MNNNLLILLGLCFGFYSCNNMHLNKTNYPRGNRKAEVKTNKSISSFQLFNSNNKLEKSDSSIHLTENSVNFKVTSVKPKVHPGLVTTKSHIIQLKSKIQTPEDSVEISATHLQKKVHRLNKLWSIARVCLLVFQISLLVFVVFIIFSILIVLDVVNVAFNIWGLILIGLILEYLTIGTLIISILAILVALIYWLINKDLVPNPHLRKSKQVSGK